MEDTEDKKLSSIVTTVAMADPAWGIWGKCPSPHPLWRRAIIFKKKNWAKPLNTNLMIA